MECYNTQIVDREGTYNVDGVRNFMTATNLSDSGHSYSVVAILGPQHGGKSTIMNRLFGTNFQQMDTFGRRKKTTEGIWIAKCVGINDRFIIAMDMEGTDGRERGSDDTAFEKQSALFALATADVVMINMWCNELGREHASNKPMLKIVFEVMMRMFSPRKVTLLFVLRDKTQTPFEHLKADVEEETHKIWNTVAGCHPNGDRDFSKYFHIEVVALSSYEKEELFEEEVAQMRKLYFASNLLERDGDRPDRLPAAEFAFSSEQIWHDIKQNKDLNIPALREMVETFRCQEIANEKLLLLCSDEDWSELREAAQAGPVSGYIKTFVNILDTYLMLFDQEATHYHEGIRNTKRQELQSRALREIAYPTFLILIGNFRSEALEHLKSMSEESLNKREEGFDAVIQTCMLEFDEACKDAKIEQADWDTSSARKKLLSEINRQLVLLRDSKSSESVSVAKDKLARALLGAIESLMEDCGGNKWASIRACLDRETLLACTDFEADVAHLKLEESAINSQIESLRHHARNVAEGKLREEASNVQLRMTIWFSKVFTLNDDGTPRVWIQERDIEKFCLKARRASLKLLADMAALRFSGNPDNIHSQLFSALIHPNANRRNEGGMNLADPLVCSRWEEVSSDDTLIIPMECKRIWSKFIEDTHYIVDQAKKTKRDYKKERGVLVVEAIARTVAQGVATAAISVATQYAGGGDSGSALAAELIQQVTTRYLDILGHISAKSRQ